MAYLTQTQSGQPVLRAHKIIKVAPQIEVGSLEVVKRLKNNDARAPYNGGSIID